MIGYRADVRQGLGVSDLPALGYVGTPVGAVGDEQGRRVVYLGVWVLAEEPSVHHASLRAIS